MTVELPAEIPQKVIDLFLASSWRVRRAGVERYSARAIMERIRWHMQIEKGDRDFKINDHWIPYLSRWLMETYPKEFSGFFETRAAKADLDAEETKRVQLQNENNGIGEGDGPRQGFLQLV